MELPTTETPLGLDDVVANSTWGAVVVLPTKETPWGLDDLVANTTSQLNFCLLDKDYDTLPRGVEGQLLVLCRHSLDFNGLEVERLFRIIFIVCGGLLEGAQEKIVGHDLGLCQVHPPRGVTGVNFAGKHGVLGGGGGRGGWEGGASSSQQGG